jgi:hypothetical protein
MRLSDLYRYVNERFPDMDPQIGSKVVDGEDKVTVDFRVTLGVTFGLDEINEETIFEDVVNTVRQGLYTLLLKSQTEQTPGVEEVPDEERKVILS